MVRRVPEDVKYPHDFHEEINAGGVTRLHSKRNRRNNRFIIFFSTIKHKIMYIYIYVYQFEHFFLTVQIFK